MLCPYNLYGNISTFHLYWYRCDELKFQLHHLLSFKGLQSASISGASAISSILGIIFEGYLQNRDPSILSECSPQRFL